jgi:hypothetical protein
MKNELTLRGAPNNVATEVKSCVPWEYVPNIPASALVDKKTYKAWRANPTTSHLVFTGYEALNPGVRVNSKTNPVRRLHALVVDYDSKINDNAFETVLDRCPVDLRPTWISRSASVGARLVYMFEAPIAVNCELLLEKFLDVAKENLQLTKIFPAFDDAAWQNVSTLYDVGSQWKKLGDHALSTNLINFWFTDASKKTAWSKLNEIHVPLDEIVGEMEARGWNWDGVFEVGARGPVFWDGGGNPTSTVVTEAGMVCFSRDKMFYPWAEIFGGKFVKKYQADKLGAAVEGAWFDGKQYYRKIDDRWVTVAKEDFARYLQSRKGLSDEKRGKASSELNDACVHVQELRRVHGAIPRLFDPRDIIEVGGQRYLNTSYIRPMPPADEVGEWGKHFPWIAEFLDKILDPPEQLAFLLAWIKRFYGGAVGGCLERGQNCFLVGPVKVGKTLLACRIIGGLVGGFCDASSHVVSGSEFNKKLGETALWTIDDGAVASDPTAHRKFAEMVKKLAANPTITYRKMYSDPEQAEWAGRLFCTLNDDSFSLQMLPDLTMSLEDKVMIFKTTSSPITFPPRHVLEPLIEKENTHFGRWLLEWTPPEHVMGDDRFGVRKYIHDGLRTAAMHSGQVGDLLELIDLWKKRSRPFEKHGKNWDGTAGEWWTEVSQDDVLKPLVIKFTVRQMGKKFVDASRIPSSGISVLNENHRANRYSIALNGHDAIPSGR